MIDATFTRLPDHFAWSLHISGVGNDGARYFVYGNTDPTIPESDPRHAAIWLLDAPLVVLGYAKANASRHWQARIPKSVIAEAPWGWLIFLYGDNFHEVRPLYLR